MARYDQSTRTGRIEYLTRLLKNTVPEATENGITALISCAVPESGVNPRRFECDYIAHGITFDKISEDTEPTVEAIYNPHGYGWADLVRWYASGGVNLDEYTYTNGFEQPIKHWLGIGLWQWTGSRTRNLANWCKANGYKYFSWEGQIAFALWGEDGEKTLFNNILKSNDTVDNLIHEFAGGWVRNAYFYYKSYTYKGEVNGTVKEELANGSGTHKVNKDGSSSPAPPSPNPIPTQPQASNPGELSAINLDSFLEKIMKTIDNLIKDIFKVFMSNVFKNANSGQYTNKYVIIKELFSVRTLRIVLNKKFFDELFEEFKKSIKETFLDGVEHINAVFRPKTPSTVLHDPPKNTSSTPVETPSNPSPAGNTPANVREACDYYRSLGGQRVGTAYWEGVAQCYGLSSEYANRLGFGPLNGGTAQRQANVPIFGSGDPAWYACDIGGDFNWTSKGWKVKFHPTIADIRVGVIFNVAPNAPYPTWGTGYAGHTGLVTNYGGGKVELTEQNGGLAPGAISVSQMDENAFIKNMASFVYPPGVI